MNNNWKKKIITFLVSQGITLLGSSIVQLAIIWHVTLQTSSGFWVTVLTLCSFIPQMIISIFSGVWADRHDRKRLIIISDTFIAAATLILALYLSKVTNTKMDLIAITVVSLIRSIGSGIQSPAVNAVIPQLVPKESLLRFNGINGSIQSAIQFMAPTIAGVILSFGTIYEILFIDVITAIVGITLFSTIKVTPLIHEERGGEASFFGDMKEGFSYVFQNPQISGLFARYGLYVFLSVPSGFLATLFIERTYGDSYFYLTANEIIGFGGMFLGGLVLSLLKGFENRRKTFSLGLAGYGLFSVALGFTTHFWQYGILMFCVCLCIPIIQSSMMTYLQENVEVNMQGRVFSLLNTIFSGVMPLGMALFGPLSDRIPIYVLIIVSGVLIILLGVIYFMSGVQEKIRI